jgi:hypothetical protein
MHVLSTCVHVSILGGVAAYVWPTYQKSNKFVEVSTTPRKLRSGRCVISTRNSVYVCTISSLLGIKYYTIINLARVWYDGLSPRERLCHLSSGFCPILLSHCQNYKIFVWIMHSLCQTGKHACQKCFMVLYYLIWVFWASSTLPQICLISDM